MKQSKQLFTKQHASTNHQYTSVKTSRPMSIGLAVFVDSGSWLVVGNSLTLATNNYLLADRGEAE